MPVFLWKKKGEANGDTQSPRNTTGGFTTTFQSPPQHQFFSSSRTSAPSPPNQPVPKNAARPGTSRLMGTSGPGSYHQVAAIYGHGRAPSPSGVGVRSASPASARAASSPSRRAQTPSNSSRPSTPSRAGPAGTPTRPATQQGSRANNSVPPELLLFARHSAPMGINSEHGIRSPTSPSSPAASRKSSFRASRYSRPSSSSYISSGFESREGSATAPAPPAVIMQQQGSGRYHAHTYEDDGIDALRTASIASSDLNVEGGVHGTHPGAAYGHGASNGGYAPAPTGYAQQQPTAQEAAGIMSIVSGNGITIRTAPPSRERLFSGQGHPAGLPPPSPTKGLKFLSRAASARHAENSVSLLAMLESNRENSSTQRAHRSGSGPGSGPGSGTSQQQQEQHRPFMSPAGSPAGMTAAQLQQLHFQRRNSTGSLAANKHYQEIIAAAAGATAPGAVAGAAGPASGTFHPPSPHAAGSASRLAEGYGTLTCIRPSVYNSNFGANFAAESQADMGDVYAVADGSAGDASGPLSILSAHQAQAQQQYPHPQQQQQQQPFFQHRGASAYHGSEEQASPTKAASQAQQQLPRHVSDASSGSSVGGVDSRSASSNNVVHIPYGNMSGAATAAQRAVMGAAAPPAPGGPRQAPSLPVPNYAWGGPSGADEGAPVPAAVAVHSSSATSGAAAASGYSSSSATVYGSHDSRSAVGQRWASSVVVDEQATAGASSAAAIVRGVSAGGQSRGSSEHDAVSSPVTPRHQYQQAHAAAAVSYQQQQQQQAQVPAAAVAPQPARPQEEAWAPMTTAVNMQRPASSPAPVPGQRVVPPAGSYVQGFTVQPQPHAQQHQQYAAAPAAASQAAAASAAAPPVAAPAPAAPQPQASSSSGVQPTVLQVPVSQPVPIMPPLLPKVDYATLMGSPIDAEHSAALPGYSVGKVIGEGGFCQVRLAVHHLSQRKVAVKIIDKIKLSDPNEVKRIQREIRVMKHLNHECVIKLFEVIDSPTRLYIVMEHAPNGSLLDYVRARKRLPEADAAFILQQIVAGLEYCHKREVVHRDIKLENVLLDVDNGMKVIDFGLSAFFVPGKRLRVHCGSPSYAAPEIVARKQYDGPPVDVWSLGVVLFAMLAGYLPFHSSTGNKQELCTKIMEGRYTAPDWMSPGAKDLLARMLTVDPARRITFEQVWSHPWVKSAQRWEPVGASVYMVRCDPATGAVYADEQLVAELETAGYSRQMVLQFLLSSDFNYLTASYYLLAEGKAEVIRRMRGADAARRYTSRAARGHPQAASGNQPLTPTGPIGTATAAAAAKLHSGVAAGSIAAAGGAPVATYIVPGAGGAVQRAASPHVTTITVS